MFKSLDPPLKRLNRRTTNGRGGPRWSLIRGCISEGGSLRADTRGNQRTTSEPWPSAGRQTLVSTAHAWLLSVFIGILPGFLQDYLHLSAKLLSSCLVAASKRKTSTVDLITAVVSLHNWATYSSFIWSRLLLLSAPDTTGDRVKGRVISFTGGRFQLWSLVLLFSFSKVTFQLHCAESPTRADASLFPHLTKGERHFLQLKSVVYFGVSGADKIKGIKIPPDRFQRRDTRRHCGSAAFVTWNFYI